MYTVCIVSTYTVDAVSVIKLLWPHKELTFTVFHFLSPHC